MKRASAVFIRLVVFASVGLVATLATAQRGASDAGATRKQSDHERQLDSPAGEAGAFSMVLTQFPSGWDAFRFNRRTGETWVPNRDRDPEWVWNKVREMTKVLPGDYDFKAACYIRDNEQRKVSFRIDRKSGKTWFLVDGAWYALSESPDFYSAAAPASGYQLLITSTSRSWEAIRFNPETGASWIPSKKDRGLGWQKVAEASAPPSSDYDVQAVSLLSKDDAIGRVLRMDRKTGRTWVQLDQGWIEIEEPAGFADMPAPASGFRLVMNASTKYWYAYRFNPETGATWIPRARDDKNVWGAIADDNALRPGDYDVQIVCWLTDDGGAHNIFRIDRKVGWMWFGSDDQKWEFINERPDITTSTAPASGFRLVTSNSEKNWYALRFNPESGETWAPNEDGDDWYADRWKDNPALPKGKYDVQMTSFIDGDDGTENVYRMDLQSGRCWNFNQRWTPVPFSPRDEFDPPPNGFQLILCPSPNACNPFRFNPANGETWGVSAEQPLLWEKIDETQAPPGDQYQLNAISYLGKDNATFDTVLRINPRSGQTWYARAHQWTAIAEPQ